MNKAKAIGYLHHQGFTSQGGDMRPIFYRSSYSNTRHLFLPLLLLFSILFSIAANAVQPFHKPLGSLSGYEDEDHVATSGTEWTKRPKYTISAITPARINSHVARKVEILDYGTASGDKITWKFVNPDGDVVKDTDSNWTGTCWTLIFNSDCMTPGWWINSAYYVGNKVGTWTIETYDVSAGIETLVTAESFEVKGRVMQITNGSNLTVYENDNSIEPLALKLIDYDNTSGTPNKLVTFEVISRPKGKASGGLNYIFKQGSSGSKIDSIEATTNFEGIAKVFFESGNKYGTYTIKATSYWAPENPVEFQVTVKKGKDPDKEEDLITELVESGRNNGKPDQCDAIVGNPINVITGNKYQEEVDFQGEGFMPLEFVRYYNSWSNQSSGFGSKWSHTYSRFIETGTEEINGEQLTVAKLHRDDGKVIKFYKDRKSWVAVYADVRSKLSLSSKKWRFETKQNTVEVYDQSGKLESISHEDGNAYTLEYNYSNKLQYVNNPSGKRLTFEYHDDGKISRVYGGFNRNYRYESRGNGMLTSAAPSLYVNKSRIYYYEDENFSSLLTGLSVANANRVSTWQYNDRGLAISSFHGDNQDLVNVEYRNDGSRTVTHGNGDVTQYQAIGQLGLGLLSDVDGPTCNSGASSKKAYQYEPSTNNLLSKTIDGVTTAYGDYDENGNPGYIIKAVGTANEQRTDFTYDSWFDSKISHIIQNSVSGGEQISHFTYDEFGHLIQQRQQGYKPDGSPVERVISYQFYGPLKQLSAIDGPRTDVNDSYQFTYHPLAENDYNSAGLKDIIGPDGTLIKANISYDYSGNVESYTASNGLTVNNTYQRFVPELESYTETVNDVSRTTFITYIANNLIATITTGYGNEDATTLTFTYDVGQRLTKVSNGLGQYIEFVLDQQSNVIAENIYDESGILQQQITSVYDKYQHISKQTSANQMVESIYATDGRLQQQTDGNNITSSFSYDELKRLTTISKDVNGTNQATANSNNHFTYDVNNRHTGVTDANGNTTSYSYDDLGNLLSETSPDKGTSTFSYDDAGNRISVTDAKLQTFTYQFDAYNRLLSTDSFGSSNDITYFYDLCLNGIGKLCKVTKGNTELSYTYTAFGDVASQNQTIGNITTTVSYSYDLQGRLQDITYPSGSIVSYSYDLAGNIQAMQHTHNGTAQSIINDATYTFSGLLTRFNFANGLTLNKSYDLAGRAINVVNGPLDLQQSFDGAANLLSQSASLYSYDALNRLEYADTNVSQQAFTYDKNSNRLTVTENSIQTQYGIAINSNLITSINALVINTDANGNTLNRDGQTLQYTPYNQLSQITNVAQYSYNGLGQRVQKTLLATGSKTSFFYDLTGQLLVEMDENGNVTNEHIYLATMPVAVLKQQANNSELFYVHTDHLNTPRAITNSETSEVWHWQSDPFGNGMANEDVDSNGITFEYNKRFTGQYYDAESGLHYNYYRDYDPKTGRYLQSDPIGLNGGMNTFGYVGGNPLMYYDPYGLLEMDDIWSTIYVGTGGWSPDQSTVDFYAGFGDSMLLNTTKHIREWQNIKSVNDCSTSYKFGSYTGDAVGAFNIGKMSLVTLKNIKRAKSWRANSRTSRRTRNRKIEEAKNYREIGNNIIISAIGGHAVNSWVEFYKLINEN
ncbi:RHS repeat-associated core domain-containing protein [Thalassotalea fonticola]|uniref:RHS repeat-associated core domain-containing protein n=1 Tax=Thalassotalea fonticola TaxID=3065649 RepID=A0ABZ0GUE5_9GAMM|nr:RHS repeat-associated core domain-containing protein [Colwelliaceae bacterium S1-1]